MQISSLACVKLLRAQKQIFRDAAFINNTLHTTPTDWPWSSPTDYSDDVVNRMLLYTVLLSCAYPQPHTVKNNGFDYAHALNVNCNEYSKIMHLVRL